MKKLILSILAACLVLSASAVGREKRVTVTGWVSDEHCGARHTKPGGEDCVKKCMRGGASVGHPEWKPQRMVFVTYEEKKIWVVENPDALKGHEGHHVKIAGRVNAARNSVHVAEVAMLGEGKN